MTTDISSHLTSAVLWSIISKLLQLLSPSQSYILNIPQYNKNAYIFNKVEILKKDAGFHESDGSDVRELQLLESNVK